MSGRRAWRARLTGFRGRLLGVEDTGDGWYELRVEGVDAPLSVHGNRVIEIEPKPGDTVEGEYDERGGLWALRVVREEVVNVGI